MFHFGDLPQGQDLTQLSDQDFLKSIGWKRGLPADLAAALKARDVAGFVSAYSAALRTTVSTPRTYVGEIPANWSLGAISPSDRELALSAALSTLPPAVRTAGRVRKPAVPAAVTPLEVWWTIQDFENAPISMWEYLVLLQALPEHLGRLSTAAGFSLWRRLVTIAFDPSRLAPMREAKTQGKAAKEEIGRFGFQADPYLDLALLRQGELPWTAGVMFEWIKGAERLRKLGAELLEHELVERTDDHGAPHAELLSRLPFWLAVMTRVHLLAADRGVRLWDRDAAELYQSFIEKVAPLIRPDGKWALSHFQVADSRRFTEVLLQASGWSESAVAIATMLERVNGRGRTNPQANGTGSTVKGRAAPRELCLAPVNQSDASEWATMRTNWGARADRCSITHDQPAFNLELTIQGVPILEGEWLSEIGSGKEMKPLRGRWTCVCWQTDEESDYIEVQQLLPKGGSLERQILLSRTERYCIVAESVSGLMAPRLTYRSHLPLVSGLLGTRQPATREVQLAAAGGPIRIFPIALPDQHQLSTPGRFTPELQFQTTLPGTACYNPILFDWAPSRRSGPAVWKKLTVAEGQKVLEPDLASGYRIKVGNHQWLIYRSLKRTYEARSFLGHQTRYETVIGRVENSGEITPLMQVE